MKLVPVADKVVLKMTKIEETTKSGIIIAGGPKDELEVGEIIAVGPGGMVDGKEVVMTVKVGQKVIVGNYAGKTVKMDREEYSIIKQSDILAIVEE